ncbi:MAG: hypothetical protein NZL96_02175 [Patescibacteria group bacterium]|nr:hypothetical protein [Patescibacteria group bacterium]
MSNDPSAPEGQGVQLTPESLKRMTAGILAEGSGYAVQSITSIELDAIQRESFRDKDEALRMLGNLAPIISKKQDVARAVSIVVLGREVESETELVNDLSKQGSNQGEIIKNFYPEIIHQIKNS